MTLSTAIPLIIKALPGRTTHALDQYRLHHESPARLGSLGIASTALFLVLLGTTAMVSAHASPREHFSHVSAADLSWTLNAYTVLYAALLVPAGRLADLLGRKRGGF